MMKLHIPGMFTLRGIQSATTDNFGFPTRLHFIDHDWLARAQLLTGWKRSDESALFLDMPLQMMLPVPGIARRSYGLLIHGEPHAKWALFHSNNPFGDG